MQQEMEAIDAVGRAIDRVSRRGHLADFEMTNGIVLILRPVPPLLIQAVNQEFKPPQPPRVYLEDKGREEENPNDPDYLRAILEMEAARELAITDLILGMGTSVKFIPEDHFGPDDDEWIKFVELTNHITGRDVKVEKEGIKRYLHWLRFYAMETGADLAIAAGLPLQLAGISESEVQEVMDSFRSLPERAANPVALTEIGSLDGNRANRATRRASKRDGGA